PFAERGTAQGAVWMAGRLMGGLTPLLWLLVVIRLDLGWRAAFVLFGVLGVGWCVAFALWFTNRPEEKPSVSDAERQLIRAGREAEAGHLHVPWRKLFSSTNLWA